MPLVWRYLVCDFLKITLLSVLAFIAVLFTMQLDEIAHFVTLGAPFTYVIFFILHQIPYILPIALPLSCLIASLLLVQRLSATHELTALRASGFALHDILACLWLTAAFLAVGNFWITSELATQSHLQNNLLKNELRSLNPLLLLHNKHLMRIKGFYFESLGPSQLGEFSSEAVIAFPNQHYQRLHLMVAQRLQAYPHLFTGEGITFITGMANSKEEDFDLLVVENIQQSVTQASDFSAIMPRKVDNINNDYLQMPLLLARIQEQQKFLKQAQLEGENQDKIQSLNIQLNRSFAEIVKRSSIAFAVFSFTFMGTALGIHTNRKQRYSRLIYVLIFTIGYLIAFFVAKGIDHWWLILACYSLPHFLMICASFLVLRCIEKGRE